MARDRSIFIVYLANETGLYTPERDLSDMDRRNTIEQIASGEWAGVAEIHEYNPAECWARDVTEDIAKAVSDIWADEGEPLNDHQREFVEAHLGVNFANNFAQAAE